MDSDSSTKKRILDAGYKMFIEKGFQGSTMRDIAKEASIKASSIYNHFENKEEIFEEIFIERHPLFRILEILDHVKGTNAEELLTNAANQLNREFQRESGLLNLFFVELVEMEGKHIAQAIRTNFPSDSNFMKQIFAFKQELRDIREPVLIRALIGTIFANIIFGWFIGDTNPRRWGAHSEMNDVLLRGLLKQ